MSSRALRKLRGSDDSLLELAGGALHEDIENEAPDVVNKPKKKSKKNANLPVNPFDLLNDGDTENQEDEELKDQESTEVTENGGQGAKSKKKKKKKKKALKDQENQAIKKQIDEEEDEIEASVREVNALLGELPSRGPNTSDDSNEPLLRQPLFAVDHRNLNPEAEMRRVFGSRVVQSENQTRRRRTHGKSLRKNYQLVQPKDQWRTISKTGLTMELLETSRGCQWFAFQHNLPYRKIQNEFWAAVDSLNPHNIMNVLQLQPFHIDALLQLSEVCKMSEDIQTATDLIERALYSFEHSFHPLFNISQGNCRLDYRRPENRAFYVALFRHLSFIGQRGCYRTALEFCKLLLGLDPDGDPMCVLLMLDFYAIKSEQFEYFLRLHADLKEEKNLHQLPNFAYSTALATFSMSQEENTEEADKMLQAALLSFPGVLMPLLDKCGVTPDAKVSKHAAFGLVTRAKQPEALQNLVTLYVGRTHACWKNPEVVSWLEENVNVVIAQLETMPNHIADLQESWQGRYRGMPRNIHRHIIISEIQEATASLPPELAGTAVMSYDPLPPTDSIVSYTRPTRRRVVDQDANTLSMFLRSLLPNFNPQEVLEERPPTPAVAQEGASAGAAANLQQGIGALMDAMRDLLNNIEFAPPPVENNNQNEEENNNDEELDF